MPPHEIIKENKSRVVSHESFAPIFQMVCVLRLLVDDVGGRDLLGVMLQ